MTPAELEKMHNHIVIVHDVEMCRLVGYGEDGSDCYYICRHLNNGHKSEENNETWHTQVGSIVSLKGLYPDDRYKHMDDVFSCNGAPRRKSFLVVIEPGERAP